MTPPRTGINFHGVVTNSKVANSYETVQWVEGTISGVNLDNVTIAGTGTFALQEQTGGAAKFTNVTATGVGYSSPVYSCSVGSFTVPDGGGNSGISGTPYCGGWPASVYPPYPSEGVTAAPSALNFGAVPSGSTSDAQTVTVSDPTNTAGSVSSVSTCGDYSQTNTCGTSIAAGASCTVAVTPTASGTRTGDLSIASNASNGTTMVAPTGTGAGTVSRSLAAGAATTEFSHTDVYPSSNVTDGNQGTYWESANSALPQWVQVDLGSAQSASRVVLQFPAS